MQKDNPSVGDKIIKDADDYDKFGEVFSAGLNQDKEIKRRITTGSTAFAKYCERQKAISVTVNLYIRQSHMVQKLRFTKGLETTLTLPLSLCAAAGQTCEDPCARCLHAI